MGINRKWRSTLAFRKFREKTHDLSRVYWTQEMGAESLLKQLATEPPDEISAKVLNCSFDVRMHTHTVSETLRWLPTFMERNRLHLLVIYTAFLETYLKEVTFFYFAARGNILNPQEKSSAIKLTKVGEASAAPILKSSTVPEMIKYAADLYSINFGVSAIEWIKIYKIRCAAAHNGGIATPKFLKEISGMPLALNPQEYENIGLTWDELRLAMRYGDDIAALIDSKISSYEIKISEIEQVMRENYANQTLPKEKFLWQFLHENYKLDQIKRQEKKALVIKFLRSGAI